MATKKKVKSTFKTIASTNDPRFPHPPLRRLEEEPLPIFQVPTNKKKQYD